MRAGVLFSFAAHAGLLVWAYLGMPGYVPEKLPDFEALPIELVTIAEVTDLAKGKESAKKTETAAISEPAPVVKPDPAPTPTPVVEETKPDPTPPPPVAEVTPPEPEEPPAPVVEKTPPPPEPPTPPVVAEKPPEPAPKPKPDPVPAPEKAKAEPPPPQEKAAKADPVPAPKPRPKPKTPPINADKKKEFDPDRIAALVNRDEKAAASSSQKANLGVTNGKPDAKMTQTELDGLKRKINECLARWSPPQGWLNHAEVRSVVKFLLNEDGTIKGVPEVIERPTSQWEQAAPEAAIRRIFACSPFKLPPEHYTAWRELTITFDPSQM